MRFKGVTLFCRSQAYADTRLNGVKLFCQRSAYADTWLNCEMLFVGFTATPTHFQCIIIDYGIYDKTLSAAKVILSKIFKETLELYFLKNFLIHCQNSSKLQNCDGLDRFFNKN